MTEIDVFGRVIKKEEKKPLKEVVETKKPVIEEVIKPDAPIIVDKVIEVEEQPKKKNTRKKKVITE